MAATGKGGKVTLGGVSTWELTLPCQGCVSSASPYVTHFVIHVAISLVDCTMTLLGRAESFFDSLRPGFQSLQTHCSCPTLLCGSPAPGWDELSLPGEQDRTLRAAWLPGVSQRLPRTPEGEAALAKGWQDTLGAGPSGCPDLENAGG